MPRDSWVATSAPVLASLKGLFSTIANGLSLHNGELVAGSPRFLSDRLVAPEE